MELVIGLASLLSIWILVIWGSQVFNRNVR